MATRILEQRTGRSQARPLCGSYFLAVHERLTVQVRDRDLARSETVRWALGLLADGSYELLGVWAAPESGSWTWDDVAEGLRVRGVEKIGLVSERGSEFPPTLSRRRIRALHASDEVMRRLQRRARGAIKRHGPCSDVADATAFVEDVLAHAELAIGAAGGVGSMRANRPEATGGTPSQTKRVKAPTSGV